MTNRTSCLRNIASILILFFTLVPSAFSEPMDEWNNWALESHPKNGCPWTLSSKPSKACIWPGRLTFAATNEGASFKMEADAFAINSFLQLPGDHKHWPTSVTINGFPAPVLDRNKLPYLSIPAGKYSITGQFEWSSKPRQLTIPQGIAIISLSVDGKSRTANQRNDQLIFAGKVNNVGNQTRDSLKIEVYRQVIDGTPVNMLTIIKLSVSGKPREVTFGEALFDNSEILFLKSPVPARVESGGAIRAQITPGEHQIQLLTRFLSNPETISINPQMSDWPKYEYISFKAAPSERQAKLSGAISIDTTQISIPNGWADLPTYRLGVSDVLTIATEYRGDHSPSANELNITRDFWLDFDGAGITSLDRISGRMNKDWRLNAAEGINIGRATVDEAPVLITTLDGVDGIEVRSPAIELSAVTRTSDISGFSVAGWDARADIYRSTLHLPPGWRVLHANGVDQISGSWISKWDLWDIFLVLIIVAATRKLISTPASALAAGALAITYHEPGNPVLLVPIFLLVLSLLPLVSGQLKSSIRLIGISMSLIIVVAFISFAVSTFRLAMYPSLERSMIGEYQSNYARQPNSISSAPAIRVNKQKVLSDINYQFEERVVNPRPASKPYLYQVSENDRVQTGPGLPTWVWNSAHFRSSGPVPAGQSLSIQYSSPLITSIWRVLSVVLVGLYCGLVLLRLVRSLEFKTVKPEPTPAGATTVLAAFILIGSSLFNPAPVTAEEYPPEYLLKELEQRLTKSPDCLPVCAGLNNGRLEIIGPNVKLSFDAYADADISLPLPTAHDAWQLKEVLVDGQPEPVKVGKSVYVRLTKGNHRVEVSGILINDSASISLPLSIHNMTTQAKGWVIEGLVDGRVRGKVLTIRSIEDSQKQEMDTLKPDPVLPFFSVKRHFSFNKQWRVNTTVVRHAPRTGAISVTVPLLDNEKLLTDIGAVSNGSITLQLGHNQNRVSWTSAMEPVPTLELISSDNNKYVEEWTFSPSSLWRLTYEGISPIKGNGNTNTFEPTFKPWSSERLTVSAERPTGVAGPTHTVEKAKLIFNAGKKIQRSELTIDIRSSLGDEYAITLPESAEILSFNIDGRSMNIPTGNRIVVPLQPGLQNIRVVFQQLLPIGVISKTPAVILPDGATNIEIVYLLPRDRWPLYLSGPSIGPAMLFWGVLCVIIIGAIGLPALATKTGLSIPVNLAGWLLLGIGLSTINSYGVLLIAVMFFGLAARKQYIDPRSLSRFRFNTLQFIIALWVIAAVISMLLAIPMGLLSNPEMKVVGNASSSHLYNYYQDLSGSAGFPEVSIMSVPIFAYRIVMLLWSLWMATRLIKWASWGWSCFSKNGVWKEKVN